MVVSDYDLIKKCIDGDQESFTELVTRYKKLIYSVVYHMVKDHDEADDISQEVFLRIYKSLKSYNPQYKFSTWSVRIATNLCLDTLRKKKLPSVSIDEVESVSRDDETPEKKYLSKEKSLKIREAIDSLPEKYRTLVILYHQKGMAYKEMADMMNKPMSIIKNRLYRARMLLKENMAGIEC